MTTKNRHLDIPSVLDQQHPVNMDDVIDDEELEREYKEHLEMK